MKVATATPGLSRNGHNYFGIKARTGGFADWTGPLYAGAKTHEIVSAALLPKYHPLQTVKRADGLFNITIRADFRRYPNAHASFMDYGHYLVHRGMLHDGEFYADAHGDTDAKQYLKDILDDDDGPRRSTKKVTPLAPAMCRPCRQ